MDTPSPTDRLAEEVAALRRELAAFQINLSGKDWLTVEEAAFYCGVSAAQFNAKARELGLGPRNFMGKKLYEKAALYRAIHDSIPWTRGCTDGAASNHVSSGTNAAVDKLRRYENKQKLTGGN